jgi:enamine deaminase RidA (YjgF/YER057c/UK114 family)
MTRSFKWLDRDFVALSGEASSRMSAGAAMDELVDSMDRQLRKLDLSLGDTVRTRMYARDAATWDVANAARFQRLAGSARSASASYFSTSYFDCESRVAMELLAMRSATAPGKIVREYEPARAPVRYIVRDSVVFLSGVTGDATRPLAAQVGDILGSIAASLADAGTSWANTRSITCFLHPDESRRTLSALLSGLVPEALVEVQFAEGYAAPGKLVEIEVTAIR